MKTSIDEQFTRIADKVTETIGKWYFTIISLIFLIGWIVYGIISIPYWFTSNAWNFPINSVSTIAEFFFELWILAAANRVERRNRMMLEKIANLAEKIESEESQEGMEIAQIEKRMKGNTLLQRPLNKKLQIKRKR